MTRHRYFWSVYHYVHCSGTSPVQVSSCHLHYSIGKHSFLSLEATTHKVASFHLSADVGDIPLNLFTKSKLNAGFNQLRWRRCTSFALKLNYTSSLHCFLVDLVKYLECGIKGELERKGVEMYEKWTILSKRTNRLNKEHVTIQYIVTVSNVVFSIN